MMAWVYRCLWATQMIIFMILATPSFSRTGGGCCHRFNAPWVEVRELVRLWAKGRACDIMTLRPKDGVRGWRVKVSCGFYDLSLEVIPDSTLATRVVFRGEVPGTPVEGELRNDLIRFLKAETSGQDEMATHKIQGETLPSRRPEKTKTPPMMNGYRALVTCVTVIEHGEGIQVSGVYLRDIGAVLTTAHELVEGEEVQVTFGDKRKLLGRVKYLDTSRDLALIEFLRPPQGDDYPQLKWRRMPLGPKDEIYFVGCPMGRGLVHVKGKVEMARNMDGQLLWQVNIKVEPGSSGSPVFDEMGMFAGVIKGRLRVNHHQGFIIPADTIRKYIASVKRGAGERKRQRYQLPIFRDVP